MEPHEDASVEAKRDAYKAIYEVTAANKDMLFNPHATGFCLRCAHDCPGFVSRTDWHGDPIMGLISGTERKAFTMLGKQERVGHVSQLVFLVFVFYILVFQPDLILHVITELHPDEIFSFHFGKDY